LDVQEVALLSPLPVQRSNCRYIDGYNVDNW
jgi:hypothetical protein